MKAATQALVLMIVDTDDPEQEAALLDHVAQLSLMALMSIHGPPAFTQRVDIRDGHIVEHSTLDTFVLLALAQHGEGTIAQIIERLAGAGMPTYTRSHVANLLKKLLDSGIVSRRRDGYAFVYAAETNPAEAGMIARTADA